MKLLVTLLKASNKEKLVNGRLTTSLEAKSMYPSFSRRLKMILVWKRASVMGAV